MSLLDSLGLSGLMGQQSNQSGLQRAQQVNQAFNTAYNNYQNGQLGQAGMNMAAQQYNQQLFNQAVMMKNRPRWIFDGVECNGPREMADIIWANDCPEKTHFLLKYE